MNTYVTNLHPAGTDERLTVSTVAVNFASTPSAAQTEYVISVQGAEVVVTLDGSTPTASNGILLPDKYLALWPRSWIIAAKLIRAASTDAAVHIQPLSR